MSLALSTNSCVVCQVTRFKCGGFSVGASMNHCMVDGLAASEFLISLGEIARGLPISIQPVLDRTLLKARDPIQIEFPHSEFAEIQTFQQANGTTQTSADDIVFSHVCFDSKTLSLLKKQILDEGIVKKCSSFEVLTACIWRTRTKALHMASSQMTKLLFAVDGRSRFCPPLPKGFHGNGIVFTCAMTSAGELANRKLSYAVGLVQEAIVMINDKYMRSAIDYFEQTRVRPSMTATLIITSWCRLPFLKADFGWGESIHYCPVGLPQPEVAVFLADDKNSGVKVFLGLPSFAWNNIKSLLL
ncbi:hypothetical protein O6H91_01G026900 [Diphasiastrum complanatum]|uniref:Uncharacterized protein n=1 Tax=Diphasiastrum complanatum TaxID=34168 RepID=A0ACC2EPC9_DIPCM|nr:hypothetical protein O6H91_01G026900 [Diphasiastrum complanatum]